MSKDAPGIPYEPQTHDAPTHTHRLQVKPSPADPRDFADKPTAYRVPPLAMIPTLPPVKDQGAEGSCTGNGFAGMYETMLLQKGPLPSAFSPAFIYYEERIYEGDTGDDAGAYPRDGCRVLKNLGVCPEPLMPYRAGDFATAPSSQAMAEAKNHRAKAYYRCLTPNTVQHWLAQNNPVGMAFDVYMGFERTGKNGVVPMPQPGETPLGGHWVYLTGYCVRPDWPGGGYYRLRNSWSASWADGGNAYIPFAFVHDPKYAQEFWRIVLP